MSSSSLPIESVRQVLLEFASLKARLEEAESTIDAIRTGAVDALVVRGENGDQVFTLQGADEPYRIFVEKMQEGAVTLDERGTILYCNLAFAEILHEPLEKVIGTQFKDYLPEHLFGGDSSLSITELGRGETYLTSAQSSVPVLCSVTPVDLDGPAAYAVTVTDLTEQKLHESQLTKAKDELEGFCYSVSHDLRAPLRGIISGASILLEDYGDILPPEARPDFDRITNSANHLAKLMDDLLQYSRLSRHDVHRQRVDLSAIVQRFAESTSLVGHENIEWSIEPDIVALADSSLIEMVLLNLLSNAVKFSAKSHPPQIRFAMDPANRAFYIEDNGIGFDMQYVEKLFKPFERLHRPNEYAGTGIGLANVKRIVNRHGGTAWAEGHPGQGAKFSFTLP